MAKKTTQTNPAIPGLLKELRRTHGEHRLSIFAAGVAFFAFIALIPALAAAVAITGLVAEPETLVAEAEAALDSSPEPTRDFIVEQIRSIAEGDSTGAGIAAAVGIFASIFSASGAVGQLMEALNVVFDRTERRSFVTKRLQAIGFMVGALLLIAAMVFTMSVLPAQLESWVQSGWLRVVISVGRFVGLALLMITGLSLLYRWGPVSHPERERELVSGGVSPLISKGATAGTILLVALSWGFGIFVNNFGSYGETYGTLATIVVVMLWLQLMALAVLIGAEVDAYFTRKRVWLARAETGLSPTP